MRVLWSGVLVIALGVVAFCIHRLGFQRPDAYWPGVPLTLDALRRQREAQQIGDESE